MPSYEQDIRDLDETMERERKFFRYWMIVLIYAIVVVIAGTGIMVYCSINKPHYHARHID
jgi:flagellar basal body-associated protein FliL